MSPVAIRLTLVALILFIFMMIGAEAAYSYEHSKLIKLESDLTTKAAVQAALVAKLNQEIKGNADESQSQLQDTAKSITDYYVAHPVRVQVNTCPGTVSSTTGNPARPDAASEPSFLTTYDPEQVELMANQLDLLEKLLIKDGVTVK
jgi:hypothetical protein